jgi:hypothetical protein
MAGSIGRLEDPAAGSGDELVRRVAADTTGMRRSILPFLLCWSGVAHAAIVHIPIKSAVELMPNEAVTVTVEAAEQVEIGWLTLQAKRCTSNCVQATNLTSPINTSIATPIGASLKYKPVDGKITVEYKNISTEPVTIDIYRVKRTCEAEACRFFNYGDKGRWLVFKVDEFKSITTSTDESYSVITGVVESGRPFKVKVVWWTEDRKALGVKCAPFVQRYLDNKTPKEKYSPYVIDGHVVKETPEIVLISISSCAPKASNYGVPQENVFK